MRKILALTISILSIQTMATTNSVETKDCMSKYREKAKTKSDKFDKKYKAFWQRRNEAMSSRSIVGALVLQNDSVPKKVDYHMYEEKVLAVVDYNPKDKSAYKPKLLQEIYNKAYSKYSDITSYEKIQDIVLKGIMSDKFCHWFGKYNDKRVSKYVLKMLKKESKDSAIVRDPAVIGSNLKLKESSDFKEEVENPTETTAIGIQE
jgi:hypothetical protein